MLFITLQAISQYAISLGAYCNMQRFQGCAAEDAGTPALPVDPSHTHNVTYQERSLGRMDLPGERSSYCSCHVVFLVRYRVSQKERKQAGTRCRRSRWQDDRDCCHSLSSSCNCSFLFCRNAKSNNAVTSPSSRYTTQSLDLRAKK